MLINPLTMGLLKKLKKKKWLLGLLGECMLVENALAATIWSIGNPHAGVKGWVDGNFPYIPETILYQIGVCIEPERMWELSPNFWFSDCQRSNEFGSILGLYIWLFESRWLRKQSSKSSVSSLKASEVWRGLFDGFSVAVEFFDSTLANIIHFDHRRSRANEGPVKTGRYCSGPSYPRTTSCSYWIPPQATFWGSHQRTASHLRRSDQLE